MTSRFARTAISVLVFCGLAAPVSLACTVTSEETAVYSAVLGVLASHPEHPTIVVSDLAAEAHLSAQSIDLDRLIYTEWSQTLKMRTSPASISVSRTTPPLFDQVSPESRRQLQVGFRALLSQQCAIPDIPERPDRSVFVSWLILRDIFSGRDAQKNWDRFHATFGDKAEMLQFSLVVFDTTGEYALVNVSSGFAPEGAGGTFYLLRRVNRNWTVLGEFASWTV